MNYYLAMKMITVIIMFKQWKVFVTNIFRTMNMFVRCFMQVSQNKPFYILHLKMNFLF